MSTNPVIAALRVPDLAAALAAVERSNDMLPPREDDKVAGRIAARFVEGLHARIAAEEYVCAPAVFVPVPKRALTTRPAAVATLRDRVVFEALVALARPRVTRFLVASEHVLWPRADATKPSWDDFERAPLEAGGGYVVTADVAGFYESVDHRKLGLVLADAGVGTDLRTAIVGQLRALLRTGRGLPQGLETSDSLATAYLAPVDAALQRVGVTFWRHGDDYRLHASDYPQALRATFELEQALRSHGLLLNSGKLRIDRFGQYSRSLNDVDRASERFRVRMRDAREKAMREATEEELLEAVVDSDIDEDMQWRYFYHGTMDRAEILEALAPSLTPGPMEVVVEMFKDLMSSNPTEKLPRNLSHARLTFCIRRLARARSPEALSWVGELLVKRPDETQDLANYLLSVVRSEPVKVAAACQFALTNKRHILDWERAWLYRVLSRVPHHVHKAILERAQDVARSDSFGWLARVEAIRLLARCKLLSRDLALGVVRQAPESFQGDLVGIVAMVEEPGNWASQYLDGARQDAVHAVVIDGVRAKIQQERHR